MYKRFRYIRVLRQIETVEDEPKLRVKSYSKIRLKKLTNQCCRYCNIIIFKNKPNRNWKEFRKTQHK